MAGKFYIMTAIPYVNAKPHIGFAMELVQGDVLARYHRLRGDDTFFLTGTDEHGSKMVQTAEEQGKTPQDLADEHTAHFKGLLGVMNASPDFFIRTTDETHKRGAQKMWRKLMEAGDLYKGSYEGLYCVGCEAFVLEKDLVDGLCPNHKKPPEKLKEENYFFRLSKYSDKIRGMIEADELKIVPQSRRNEILAVLKEGLHDVSFSRPKKSLKWGVDVPDDPDQVMYVWCDALSNYITGIGYADETEQFQRYWPADVQIIGKDILRFHAAIWIGMLLSAGLPVSKAIYVHGFITSEGQKMSKSLNNVVDPVAYVEEFSADALRYFLMKEIPTTDDGDFSRERFLAVYDSELANNIGNLLSRVTAMTGKYFEGKVPLQADDAEMADHVKKVWQQYDAAIGAFDLKKGLEQAAALADFANKYVEDQKPWVLANEQPEKLALVMYNLLEMLRHIGFLLVPFVPATAEKILLSVGAGGGMGYPDFREWGGLEVGAVVTKAEPLFMRVETE